MLNKLVLENGTNLTYRHLWSFDGLCDVVRQLF